MLQKGIVLKSKKDEYTLVLTRQNDWIELPYQEGVEVGEEITFTVPVKKSWWKYRKVIPILSTAAAACLASLMLFSPWLAHDTHASTYISVESKNSHLEVGVSSEKQVVNIQTDSSSQKVIQHMHNWKNEKLDAFVIEYLEMAKKHGILKSKDKVIVAEKNVSSPCTKLMKQLQQEIKKIPALKTVELFVLPLPPKVYQQAKIQGIPPAKYVILIVARKENIPVPLVDDVNVDIDSLLEVEPVKQLLTQPPESEEEWMALLGETTSDDSAISTENETASESEEITSTPSSESSSSTTSNPSSESTSSTTSNDTSSTTSDDSSSTSSSEPNSSTPSPSDSSSSGAEPSSGTSTDDGSVKEPKQNEQEPPAEDGTSTPTTEPTQEQPTQEEPKKEEPKKKPSPDPSQTPSDQPSNDPSNNDVPAQPEPPKEEPTPAEPKSPEPSPAQPEAPVPEQPAPPNDDPTDPEPVIEPLTLISRLLK